MVPGGARGRPRFGGARPLHLPRRDRARRGASRPTDWESLFGGPAWERVADGQWYLHYFAVEQPDLNWAQPRGARGLRAHAAVLVGPRRRRLPHRRRPHADEGPDRAAADAGRARRAARRRQPPHRRPRRRARGLRRVARGLRRVRPAAHRGRRGVGRPRAASRSTRAPRASARRSTSTCSRRTSTRTSSAGSSTDNLELAASSGSSTTWVLSNHDVVRHATRYGLPHPPRDADGRPARKHGNEWLLSGGRRARARPRRWTSARAGRHSLRARAARARPTSTRARSSACTRSPKSRRCRRQDPTFFRSPGLDVGTGRMPRPAAVDAQRQLVRLRRRRRPPAAAGVVRRGLGRGAGRRPRLDADALPPGAGAAARAAVGRAAHVDRHRPAGRAAVRRARTAGRSSRTSARSPTNSIERDAVLSSIDAPFGVVPAESTVWLAAR